MKALALDCAVTKFTVAAKNDEHVVAASSDAGMRQSELLLPAIDYGRTFGGSLGLHCRYRRAGVVYRIAARIFRSQGA